MVQHQGVLHFHSPTCCQAMISTNDGRPSFTASFWNILEIQQGGLCLGPFRLVGICERAFFAFAHQLWNALPRQTQLISPLNSFPGLVKTFFFGRDLTWCTDFVLAILWYLMYFMLFVLYILLWELLWVWWYTTEKWHINVPTWINNILVLPSIS